ncbi:MAG TPA: 50S ribosomal protein L29 [Clostridiales bacterium]|nr:50S ribosomal protein L29 [Clostridiales bacterium]
MKMSELRKLKDSELALREKELKEELFNLRFQLATGQLTNTMKISECKRNIARVKTLISERVREAAKSEAKGVN